MGNIDPAWFCVVLRPRDLSPHHAPAFLVMRGPVEDILDEHRLALLENSKRRLGTLRKPG
jgi:hypothetical protein